jgi:hypothetical protein
VFEIHAFSNMMIQTIVAILIAGCMTFAPWDHWSFIEDNALYLSDVTFCTVTNQDPCIKKINYWSQTSDGYTPTHSDEGHLYSVQFYEGELHVWKVVVFKKYPIVQKDSDIIFAHMNGLFLSWNYILMSIIWFIYYFF